MAELKALFLDWMRAGETRKQEYCVGGHKYYRIDSLFIFNLLLLYISESTYRLKPLSE